MGDVTDYYLGVFITAIVAFVILLVSALQSLCLFKVRQLVIHVLFLLEVLSQVVLIVFYT